MKILSTALVLLALTSAHAATTVEVIASKSKVEWTGEKLAGKHNGTVPLKSGKLEFEGNKLKGGTFELDLENLQVTDLTGEWKDKLTAHLKNADFFDTTTHKTATLVIKDVQFGKGGVYNVVGDLTIKGITKPVTFDATSKEGKSDVTFKSKIKFDRTAYDIKYNSGKFFDPKTLADKMIKDEVVVDVNLVASKPAVPAAPAPAAPAKK